MYINLNIGRENNFPNVYRTNQTQSTDGVETKNSMKSEQKDLCVLAQWVEKTV